MKADKRYRRKLTSPDRGNDFGLVRLLRRSPNMNIITNKNKTFKTNNRCKSCDTPLIDYERVYCSTCKNYIRLGKALQNFKRSVIYAR